MSKSNGFAREGLFSAALLKELRKIPRTKWWRCNTGRRGSVTFGEVGAPDLMGILPRGRFIGIECKQPGQVPSPPQDRWHQQAIELGAICLVVDNMADAIKRVVAEL